MGKWHEDPEYWDMRARKEARDPANGDWWSGDLAKRMDAHPSVGGKLLWSIPVVTTSDAERGTMHYFKRIGCAVEIGHDHWMVFKRSKR